ncbi:hypothetical protein Q2K19_24720 [Micromonospora soli]|uniref:hypothetical protein n=1 Tax=Micromonospora sp. NBRC 110009 TaxID=3061627 RepID=UPI002672A42D|nr:hypothetical protein [Micromonospora sp. NBRC 110009]WKT97353.1 hypothetical protein Q2K19_24720 [Micromonospora sp. NBRC 110009]
MGRMGDVLVGAAGDVAGAVVDPRQGLSRLRAAGPARALVTAGAGLVIGYLVARSRRRR